MYDCSIFSSPSVLMIFLSVEGRSMEYSEVVSAFSKLVETHFLQRCPPVAEMGTAAFSTPATPSTPAAPASTAPPTAESNPDCYKLPHVTLIGRGKRRRSSDDSEEQRGGKKVKMNSESCGDEGIYWQVNFERFHQHFRDQSVISAVASKLDQASAGEVPANCGDPGIAAGQWGGA